MPANVVLNGTTSPFDHRRMDQSGLVGSMGASAFGAPWTDVSAESSGLGPRWAAQADVANFDDQHGRARFVTSDLHVPDEAREFGFLAAHARLAEMFTRDTDADNDESDLPMKEAIAGAAKLLQKMARETRWAPPRVLVRADGTILFSWRLTSRLGGITIHDEARYSYSFDADIGWIGGDDLPVEGTIPPRLKSYLDLRLPIS